MRHHIMTKRAHVLLLLISLLCLSACEDHSSSPSNRPRLRDYAWEGEAKMGKFFGKKIDDTFLKIAFMEGEYEDLLNKAETNKNNTISVSAKRNGDVEEGILYATFKLYGETQWRKGTYRFQNNLLDMVFYVDRGNRLEREGEHVLIVKSFSRKQIDLVNIDENAQFFTELHLKSVPSK